MVSESLTWGTHDGCKKVRCADPINQSNALLMRILIDDKRLIVAFVFELALQSPQIFRHQIEHERIFCPGHVNIPSFLICYHCGISDTL